MRSQIAIVLALCAVLALPACGDSGSSEGDSSGPALDQAKSFRDFTLYYLGDSFEGLPLEFADLGAGRGTSIRRSWDFIYGDCTPPAGEGGCAPPLNIQNWSICTRFPALYPGPTPRTTSIRGAEALPAGGGLDVYTGRTTVVIFGGDKPAVIRSLKRIRDDVTPKSLPPPVPGALEGKLPCQAERLRRFDG